MDGGTCSWLTIIVKRTRTTAADLLCITMIVRRSLSKTRILSNFTAETIHTHLKWYSNTYLRKQEGKWRLEIRANDTHLFTLKKNDANILRSRKEFCWWNQVVDEKDEHPSQLPAWFGNEETMKKKNNRMREVKTRRDRETRRRRGRERECAVLSFPLFSLSHTHIHRSSLVVSVFVSSIKMTRPNKKRKRRRLNWWVTRYKWFSVRTKEKLFLLDIDACVLTIIKRPKNE